MSINTVYPNLPERDYRSGEWAELPSWSSVKKCLLESPLHCRHALDNPTTPTPAMKLGALIHTLILEPGKFDSLYSVEEVNRRTKDGKARVAELEEQGIELLSPDEANRARGIAQAGTAVLDAELDDWWENDAEVSVCSDVFGVAGKCRIDLASPGDFIIDVKTASRLDAREAENTAWRYGYLGQLASYRTMLDHAAGCQTQRLGILWVCTTEPYWSALQWLSDDAWQRGHRQATDAWTLYGKSAASNFWPGPALPTELGVPGWAR